MRSIFMKAYVVMTLKQTLGNSILVLVVCTLILSCNTVKKNRKFNYFSGTEFYNYPLNVSGHFFGDVKYYETNEVDQMDEVSSVLAFYKLRDKDLLVYGKTTESPLYQLYVFFKKKKSKLKDKPSQVTTKLLVDDTSNNLVLYEKSNGIQSFFVAIKSIGKHKSNKSILQDGKSIVDSMEFSIHEKNTPNYMDIFNSYKNDDNYLFVMNKLDSAPISKDPKNEWTKFQLLTTILSFDTEYYRYKELIKKFESKRSIFFNDLLKDKKNSLLKREDNQKKEAVISMIAEASKNYKVLMLNEMHWKPEHRVFATSLLKPLKENGYTHLAIEALDKGQDSLINSRKFAIKTSGYYTREPFFSNFIREACALGFKIVGYDDFESINREETQAENLKHIIDRDSSAKVFVYAGIDHILEKGDSISTKRMAAFFKEKTGIDPLTIDQVEIVSDIPNELLFFESKIFLDVEKVNCNVDYFLINNIKPSFSEFSNLTEITISDLVLKEVEGQEVLMNFYDAKEYYKYSSRSIPIISRIKKVVGSKVIVDVPKGNFFLVIKNKENKELLLKDIGVN
ncbi:hypothetical protein LXD69_03075 [Flavobacterium sediminilitoris]|uniref:Uncharacterized protein n=1 Tax=Flavobacterium sediminilitoris TaxID=2024526 RepID=A0ABY4HQK4_9FLAO|nr:MULTISPECIES: hypothetical protein [Flavobacterium]UOX34501.1 hypothetical protein LXD69_03075 [Flavobacterium sediminilitoris]